MTTQRAGDISADMTELFRAHGVHACITAKVHSSIEVFGTMWLFFHRRYIPSEYDNQLADVLAVQLAAAIQNIELITANRNHAEALERRVQERTHELAMALKKAESVDQLKTQLLSTVSHELRTPLAVIKAHSSTELAYYDRLPKERHIQYLTTINEETDRLTALINSLLDMSRLDAGALDIRPSAIEPILLLQQLGQTLQYRYSQYVITVDAPPVLDKVMADPLRLEQLMNNLVENATRFSSPQTPIQLGARAWDDALELWVKDEGSGFSKEEAQHVFDRFFMASDLMHHQSGSGIGLGLAICKGIVESMGGRIWCETDGVNHGSRFAFTVPWAAT
jgi:two-component system, OmpR family, sensor histidine kinase KdpD